MSTNIVVSENQFFESLRHRLKNLSQSNQTDFIYEKLIIDGQTYSFLVAPESLISNGEDFTSESYNSHPSTSPITSTDPCQNGSKNLDQIEELSSDIQTITITEDDQVESNNTQYFTHSHSSYPINKNLITNIRKNYNNLRSNESKSDILIVSTPNTGSDILNSSFEEVTFKNIFDPSEETLPSSVYSDLYLNDLNCSKEYRPTSPQGHLYDHNLTSLINSYNPTELDTFEIKFNSNQIPHHIVMTMIVKELSGFSSEIDYYFYKQSATTSHENVEIIVNIIKKPKHALHIKFTDLYPDIGCTYLPVYCNENCNPSYFKLRQIYEQYNITRVEDLVKLWLKLIEIPN